MPHLHMRQTETMTLVRGELLVTVNGEPRRVQQGETLSLSPRSGHTLRNETQREVHAYVEFRPALRSEEFLRTIFGLAERGETDDKGDVSFLQAAAMMPRYEMYRADVPLLLQRILFAILGPIARLIGYQSTLER